MILLFLFLIQVHQVDHVTLVNIPLLSLGYEGILKVLLTSCALTAHLVDFVHVVTILVNYFGLSTHACPRAKRLRIIGL